MRQESETTKHLYKDIKDQPAATHTLILTLTDLYQGAPVEYRVLFAVDSVDSESQEGQVQGIRYAEDDFKHVVSFTPDHSWILVHNDYVELPSLEEYRDMAARDLKERFRSVAHYQKVLEKKDDEDIIARYGTPEPPAILPPPAIDSWTQIPDPEPEKPFDVDGWLKKEFPDSNPEEGPSGA